jgi:hypothetical protein
VSSSNNTIFTQIGGSFLSRKEYEKGLTPQERPFSTFVVKEFYNDPGLLSSEARSELERQVSNSNYVKLMPVNSILGIDIENGKGKEQILYPFFSQHLCLPIKPGEEVWAYREGNLYYWLSRKAGSYQTEDPNYSHLTRQVNAETPEDQRSSKSAWKDEQTTTSTLFPEGHTDFISNRVLGTFNSFEQIINNSVSYNSRFEPEPVPRIVKKPGDLVIQGSNNSSITLGTSADKGAGKGSIDLVTGRTISNQIVDNDRNYQEINKQLLATNDAPVSYSSDKSRLYITMLDDVDRAFQIDIDGIEKSGASSAAVLKSDQVRLVARNDVKIKAENSGASIVIRANGDIVVVPGSEGQVYLAGTSSDQPYLRYDQFSDIINRILDITTVLQSNIPIVSAAAAVAAVGSAAGPAAASAASQPATSASDTAAEAMEAPIDAYTIQINDALESIKSSIILGS